MRVVIPAAGLGTRLRPHTFTMPKPLIHVGSGRMIDYVMESFGELEVSEVTVITGYMEEQLIDYLKSRYQYRFNFISQEERLGLGHAVYRSLDEASDEDILIVLSDSIIKTDMHAFTRSMSSVSVMEVDEPERFGIVSTEGDMITDMTEKPEGLESGYAITGLYYFSDGMSLRTYLKHIIDNGIMTKDEYQLTDAMKMMIDSNIPMRAVEADKWIDCGTHDMLIEANRELLAMENRTYFREGDTGRGSIGDNVSVFGNASITGSNVEDSIIMENAVIRNCDIKNSVIGRNCTVENFSGKLIASDFTSVTKED